MCRTLATTESEPPLQYERRICRTGLFDRVSGRCAISLTASAVSDQDSKVGHLVRIWMPPRSYRTLDGLVVCRVNLQLNPLTAGAADIRVLFFIGTLSTTF